MDSRVDQGDSKANEVSTKSNLKTGSTSVSSVINLVNSILGAGTFGLSFAFAKAGFILALIIFLSMLSLAYLSMFYVVHVSDGTQMFSYGEVSYYAEYFSSFISSFLQHYSDR